MNRQSGFSLLEVMIVGALMVPALAIILRATDMATNNLSADDTVGRYMESLQRSAVRIASIIRPCSLATYRMESTQVDVDETAAEEVAEAALLTYTRTVPSHAIELTAAYLDRHVARTLERRGIAVATLRQQQDLAAVIHLCGAGAADAYARRGFRLTPGQRCGDHDVARYLAKLDAMKRRFVRLAADR